MKPTEKTEMQQTAEQWLGLVDKKETVRMQVDRANAALDELNRDLQKLSTKLLERVGANISTKLYRVGERCVMVRH